MTNNARFTFTCVGVNYMDGLQRVLSETNTVGDTKYNVECRYLRRELGKHSEKLSLFLYGARKV